MNSSYKSNIYILLAPNAHLSGTVSVFEPPILDAGGVLVEFGGAPPDDQDQLLDQSDIDAPASQEFDLPGSATEQQVGETSLGQAPEVFVGGSGPGVY